MKARLPQGMGGGPKNMQNMLRQAQKMQEDIERKQAELAEKEYVVSSGGGMVEVTVTGKHILKHFNILRVNNLRINSYCLNLMLACNGNLNHAAA